jgi:hypothetical protein
MPKLEDYVGQVLDDKYRLEQLLGQGGMGAVYGDAPGHGSLRCAQADLAAVHATGVCRTI